ncbi:integrase core domain-containing protein [Clostridium sp. VAP51]|uniref:integrase core domain-containing protein n=1 Tax=Clostridium sp. VAP51 TaxID=2949978 RepID=UPI00338FF0F5
MDIYILDTFDNSIISSHISGRPGDVRTYYDCLNDLKFLTKQRTTPTDNPIIESINGWIKNEIASDYNINSYASVSEFLQEFVLYYNNDRPAYALGYLSPKQYRLSYGFT